MRELESRSSEHQCIILWNLLSVLGSALGESHGRNPDMFPLTLKASENTQKQSLPPHKLCILCACPSPSTQKQLVPTITDEQNLTPRSTISIHKLRILLGRVMNFTSTLLQ